MKKILFLMLFLSGIMFSQELTGDNPYKAQFKKDPLNYRSLPMVFYRALDSTYWSPVHADGILTVGFGTSSTLTRIDTVLDIGNTAIQLSSLIDTLNLVGGGLHITNQETGETVVIGSSANVGIGATNSGDILFYREAFDDWGGFYPSTTNIWLKGSAANTRIRLKAIHQ